VISQTFRPPFTAGLRSFGVRQAGPLCHPAPERSFRPPHSYPPRAKPSSWIDVTIRARAWLLVEPTSWL
jgi:hypothetical protein